IAQRLLPEAIRRNAVYCWTTLETQISSLLPCLLLKLFQHPQPTKMSSEKKDKLEPQIKSVDMTEDMQQEAVEVAIEAMEKYHIEKDIAQYIKREFDSRKGATWHCVVGRNFGSFVTHETKHFIYFYLGHCAILLFKTQ
ncbi:hypothetical protein ANOM_009568, partial [Aspergillus nomiae NRRL 13137]